VKRRWGVIIGLVVAGIAVVPLATAGAQAPPSTGEVVTAPEGSVPPGGTVNCTGGATLTPDHGPPGTVVTVDTVFQANCDDLNEIFLVGMTCSGSVGGVPDTEALNFAMTVDPLTGNATGTFTAPIAEPNPPVVDATVALSVTVTCNLPSGGSMSPPAEGNGGTTYVYPALAYTLELFAENDGDQPTLVDNDGQVVDDDGVVSGSPSFTG
jgi:hypothetical protein